MAELKAAGVKVRLDAQVATSFGRRATDWELKGVPVRIEVGPRDLAEGHVTLVRRDTGEKIQVGVGEVAARVTDLLDQIQAELLAGAIKRRDDRTVEASTIDEAVEAGTVGFARIAWDLLRDGGEAKLAQDAITVRCLQTADGGLPASEDDEGLVAYVARSVLTRRQADSVQAAGTLPALFDRSLFLNGVGSGPRRCHVRGGEEHHEHRGSRPRPHRAPRRVR